MKRQQDIAAFCNAADSVLAASENLTRQKKPSRAREMNQKKQESPFLRGSLEEGKKGRKGNKPESFTQAALNESYKAKNQFFSESALSTSAAQDLWDKVRRILQAELTQPAFSTWIDQLRPFLLDSATLVVAAGNEFNREQLLKRYGNRIKQILSELTDDAISLEVVVVDSPVDTELSPAPAVVAPIRGVSSKRTPWAAGQNPTNNAEIERLLDQYGDMRGIFRKWSLFQKPMLPESEGGWNIGLGALINAGKQYGLERVIWATRQAKAYVGAENRGSIFFHALRNGLRPD